MSLTGNINSGHFDVYLFISNILNVTENVIVTLEVDFPISYNVSVTDNLINKSKKRCRQALTLRNHVKEAKQNKKPRKPFFGLKINCANGKLLN